MGGPGFHSAPHVYGVSFENIEIGADAMDLFTLVPGAAKYLTLLGIELDNVAGVAAAGDATEQYGRLAIIRGHDTEGSGGSAATPKRCHPGSPPPEFTARVNDTTLATGAGAEVCHPLSLPSRAGVLYRPGRFMRWHTGPGSLLVVRLMDALTTPFAASLTAYVAEYEATKSAPGAW